MTKLRDKYTISEYLHTVTKRVEKTALFMGVATWGLTIFELGCCILHPEVLVDNAWLAVVSLVVLGVLYDIATTHNNNVRVLTRRSVIDFYENEALGNGEHRSQMLLRLTQKQLNGKTLIDYANDIQTVRKYYARYYLPRRMRYIWKTAPALCDLLISGVLSKTIHFENKKGIEL